MQKASLQIQVCNFFFASYKLPPPPHVALSDISDITMIIDEREVLSLLMLCAVREGLRAPPDSFRSSLAYDQLLLEEPSRGFTSEGGGGETTRKKVTIYSNDHCVVSGGTIQQWLVSEFYNARSRMYGTGRAP